MEEWLKANPVSFFQYNFNYYFAMGGVQSTVVTDSLCVCLSVCLLTISRKPHTHTNTHTHTIVLWLFWILSGTTRVNRYQKCKTTPTSHHSVFYWPDALPATQPTALKCWRKLHQIFTVLLATVAWSYSGGFAIHDVLLVLLMTLCLHIIELVVCHVFS